MSSDSPTAPSNELTFLTGGGEMGERMRAFDWTRTPLGPPETWPQSLRSAVSMMLPSKAQIICFWGPELTALYNDGYRPVFGGKHPRVLGLPGREAWSEVWEGSGLRGLLQGVIDTGEAFSASDRLFVVERFGYPEETYFDVSYDPVRDESGRVGGIYCIVTETTARVIGERRLKTLRDLGARTRASGESVETACAAAVDVLAENSNDLPFVLVYLLDPDQQSATLCQAAGLQAGARAAPRRIDLTADGGDAAWPLAAVLRSGATTVTDLPARFGPLRGSIWPEAIHTAVVLPIARPGQQQPAAFLVAGVSPRRALDPSYHDFLELVAGHIAAAIANARAYAEERRRAEALAELDRDKTRFFSNVSHEFRTPLTLMLGPVEDMLETAELPAPVQAQLAIVHRNSLRLLKLVNTMLDFSRIEAGRMQANYEPVDLAAFTAELASNFRSVIERADLRLVVQCPPLTATTYVDCDMWEKIVLNLLSNAFKYTLRGTIEVRLEADDSHARLTVSDTGVGIPAAELPQMFARFHRVKGSRGRTHEGTGIGLALVQELVRLHGGSVRVESVLDQGSSFIVTIPLGSAHLDPAHVQTTSALAPTRTGSHPYVEEALRWLQGGGDGEETWARTPQAAEPAVDDAARAGHPRRARVLWAEDNADMRHYVARLLGSRFDVEAVADGRQALAAARAHPPDVVLSDVMMPDLDGFGLLRELRADSTIGTVPVILLSARAAEEARVEGMQAGADDYLVKPFSARELIARVDSQVRMAAFRRAATQELRNRTTQFETLLEHAPLGVHMVDHEFRIRGVNPVAALAFGDIRGGVEGRDFEEVMHVLWDEPYADEIVRIFRHTLATGAPYLAAERAEYRIDRATTEYYEWRIHRIQLPTGHFGVVCYFRDISAQVQARQAIEQSREALRLVSDSVPALISYIDARGYYRFNNKAYESWLGVKVGDLEGRHIRDVLGEQAYARLRPHLEAALAGKRVRFEDEIPYSTGGTRFIHVDYVPDVGPDGAVAGLYVLVSDISERKQIETSLRRSEARLAIEADALGALNDLSSRLWQSRNLTDGLEQMLAATIAMLRADKGKIQLLDAQRQVLTIAAQQGFAAAFLEFFREVDVSASSARGRALRSLARTVVPDIEADPEYEPLRDVLRAAGCRAVQSMPLIGRDGTPLGVISTHFAAVRQFQEHELHRLDLCARQAADFIERLRAEESLRRLVESERAARTEAEQAGRLKDEFLATLSHELRTPLNAILGWCQVLAKKIDNRAIVQDGLDVITRNARAQADLIADLLDMQRIVSGKVRLEITDVSLPDIVTAALDTVQHSAETKGLQIHTTIDPDAGPVRGDAGRLQQILWNLLSNAVKFTPSGGRIHVTVARDDADVEITVQDSGCGITPDFLPHLFGRFRQGDASTTRQHGGLGLGLSIVKHLVELHGGSVRAASEGPGRGATFTVRLPIAVAYRTEGGRGPWSGAAAARNVADVVGDVDLSGIVVLAVDDQPDACDLLRYLLEQCAARVITAGSVDEALSACDRERPSLVLCDIGMPGKDGYAFIRELRNRGDQTPAVAVTAFARSEDRARVLRAGYHGHIAKPVEAAELIAAVVGLARAPRVGPVG